MTQPSEIDWHAEAGFWQRKYTEQLLHSTQVIAALSRQMPSALSPIEPVAEKPAATKPARRNGAQKIKAVEGVEALFEQTEDSK